MKNLRPMPIVLTAAISGAVLFGGWFAYADLAVEKPLKQTITSVKGVAEAKPVLTKDTVTVELALDDQADLRTVYNQIRKKGASEIGNRELVINIKQKEDAGLERIWSAVLFDLAQAMENRRYAEIPAAADRLMKENEGLTVDTEMDETNVYLTLRLNGAVKFVILPRIPETMGGWPNA
ncbi:hypothetical protein BG53_05325 [Paenibacillus darwinianus]|uniref:Uncharacterized protein n=1 Tax=Paenibacillus darwinianus TaxID=1380763 RepID=A0A9W5W885_9BACL|nr:hypothetical protein [Paenibacillus darwinianus]EXX91165.1 hypothetical protein BG52_11150 [Paenibacillus darwinianus]EXX92032.1 hypothetical protein BG53_05325 [Paenibacillus darwinianus]EXX92633.1 hypothetical protein CH50_08285 [Paenibacillus darwinianus]